MKILVWATTLGADLWAFTHWLDQRPDTDVRVCVFDPEGFYREGIWKRFPFRNPLYRRSWFSGVMGVPFFKPDVTIIDNHVPLRATSKKGFVLWHGFGWKGPNDEKEFAYFHFKLRMAWGNAKKPNPNFRWQTFGPWDFWHRTEISGFHPQNCRILGAASHDVLLEPLEKRYLQPYYPFDVVNRKTVLIAPTWHYGEVFAHWGSDAELFDRLLGALEDRDANVILRPHDSFRYDQEYLDLLHRLERRHSNTVLMFKDKHPDNLFDMQVADVLITNFSSIANLYYATKRPTVHIYPVKSADEAFIWRTLGVGGVRKQKVDNVRFVWKLPPEEHGGLMAHSFDELLAQVEESLDDPGCCEQIAQDFMDKHMLGGDGKTCDRCWDSLCELVEA